MKYKLEIQSGIRSLFFKNQRKIYEIGNKMNSELKRKQLKENIKTIYSFLKLPDNWDGEGAQPFSDDFIEFVSNILLNLSIQPDVFPLQNGNVALEFGNAKDKYLEIIISPQKQMSIYKKDGIRNKEKYSIPYKLEIINHELTWFAL